VSTAVFILLTSDEGKIPATIVSRCQRIELFPLPLQQVEEALVARWAVQPDRARLLARLSGGRLGWAVTMAKDEAPLRQRSEWLDEWLEMLDSDLDARFTYAARIVERFGQNRQPLLERLALLRDLARDLLLVKTSNAGAIVNIDRVDALKDMASDYSLAGTRRFVTAVQSAIEQLNLNVNPQLAIEVLMLNMPERGKVKEGRSLT
jgi:DNA polymerase-3 subunit delta'